MRILLIEDDIAVSETISRALRERNHIVDIAMNGLDGEEMGVVSDYDLILLDLMLPGKDGREVCRSLRGQGCGTPILMMTALGGNEDIVYGLDSGADDYLVKPIHPDVLLARIRSLTRRTREHTSSVIQVADLVIDLARRTVTRGTTPIHLSAKEFALLEYLAHNQGKVLTREMISEHIWDMNFDPRSNVVDSLVRFLRIRIDRGSSQLLIHTVRGMGYRFGPED